MHWHKVPLHCRHTRIAHGADTGNSSWQRLNSIDTEFTPFSTSLSNRILIGCITLIIGEIISGMFTLLYFIKRWSAGPFHCSNKCRNKHEQYSPSACGCAVAFRYHRLPPRDSRRALFPITEFSRLCQEYYFFCHSSASLSFCCTF